MLKNKKAYMKLSLTQALSQFGSYFTMFAITWIIIDKSESSVWVAAYLSYSLFLFAVFSLVAGKILDTFPRKKVIIAADIVGFLCLVGLSLCEKFGCASFPLYFAVTFLTHLAGTVIMVGTQSIMGGVGNEKEVAKAQAMFETTRRIFMIASPVLAGILLEYLGRWEMFALDSITYLVSLLGTIMFLWDEKFEKSVEKSNIINYLLPKINWNKKVVQIVVSAILVNLIYAPLMLLWPVLTKTFNEGASFMGLLSGTFVFGSLMGGVWIIKSKNNDLHRQTFNSMLLIAGGFLLVFVAKVSSPYLLIIPIFLMGLGFGSLSGPIMSIMHSNVPKEKKGSFFGWLGFVGQIGQPLIILITGFISQKFGIWYFILFMVLLSFSVAALFNKSKGKNEEKGAVIC